MNNNAWNCNWAAWAYYLEHLKTRISKENTLTIPLSIGPKGIATFCFLIKYAVEQPCYGFNADNYFHPGFRVDDNRRMEIGEYMITTTIKAENTESEATFLLRELLT